MHSYAQIIASISKEDISVQFSNVKSETLKPGSQMQKIREQRIQHPAKDMCIREPPTELGKRRCRRENEQ